MKYNVRANLLGSYSVHYDCPKCAEALTSPISDAGKRDACPECGEEFVVPGEKEKATLQEREKQAAVEREKLRRKQREAQERKRLEDEKKRAERRHQLEAERIVLNQRQAAELQRQEQERSKPVACPYCSMEIPRYVQKCGHCGEWLVGTGHSDVGAAVLGCLFGPVGLWYKGQWAAGFAWLVFFFLTMLGTAGLGLILAPIFWIGMTIHAAIAPGKR